MKVISEKRKYRLYENYCADMVARLMRDFPALDPDTEDEVMFCPDIAAWLTAEFKKIKTTHGKEFEKAIKYCERLQE